MSLKTFTQSYIETLFWSEEVYDENGNALGSFEDLYDPSDLTPEARKDIEDDCAGFYEETSEMYDDDEWAGHNFCLSRNGHGAGFWDSDHEHADELHEASKPYGTQGLDAWDGKVHTHS